MLKIFTYGFIVLTLLLLSGCGAIFTLPSGEPDEFTLRKKECGALLGSTRKEVQDLFGPPYRIAHGIYTTYYIYEWRSTAVGVVLVYGIPIPAAVKDAELHCILMLFDEDDVLYKCRISAKYSKNMTDSSYQSCREVFGFPPWTPLRHTSDLCTEEMNKQAEKRTQRTEEIMIREEGDPDAMYQLFLTMRDEYIEPVAAWEWLCKAADLGYENAQLEVAYWHRESNWEFARTVRIAWMCKAGIQADDRIAYLWYTLAAKGDEKILKIRDDLFSATLSGKEIAEAKDMVSNWRPGQCPTPYQ